MVTMDCGINYVCKWTPNVGFLTLEPYYSLRLLLPLGFEILLAHTLISFPSKVRIVRYCKTFCSLVFNLKNVLYMISIKIFN